MMPVFPNSENHSCLFSKVSKKGIHTHAPPVLFLPWCQQSYKNPDHGRRRELSQQERPCRTLTTLPSSVFTTKTVRQIRRRRKNKRRSSWSMALIIRSITSRNRLSRAIVWVTIFTWDRLTRPRHSFEESRKENDARYEMLGLRI